MFNKRKKNNAVPTGEVNLVPFIDLLSVCICFMLLTAVWLQAGVLSTKQGLGTESESKKENALSVWVELESKDSVLLSTQGFKQNSSKKRVAMKSLSDTVAKLKQDNPELRTGLVLPNAFSSYEELVRAMDQLRKAELIDIGISPI
jgi:biopolymer transport protein ExbD